MERTLTVGLDEDGHFNRDEADALLSYAMDTMVLFGGTWGLIPIREQQENGDYVLVELKLIYNSFVPARKQDRPLVPVEDSADDGEPVAA